MNQNKLIEELLTALEFIESVYRINVVKDGEPSSILNHLQDTIAKARNYLSDLPIQDSQFRCLTATRNMKGEVVMISWQDDEHRILEVLWERNPD